VAVDAGMTAVSEALLTAPNVSEGRDPEAVDAIGRAFASTGARLLDVHRDADHNRSVFTLAAGPGLLAAAVVAGAREVAERVDMSRHDGVHPCVGALDVAPFVHLDDARRGPACVEALVAADELARALDVPVLLYGVLAGGRTRAELRRGGLPDLARRLAGAELAADFGPSRAHPTAGATLVAARPPLVAFNVELAAPAGLEQARAIAAALREGGREGLPGARALGLWLDSRDVAQVSFNLEDGRTRLGDVVAAVARHGEVAGAELVGLAPRAMLEGFPADVPVRGGAAGLRSIENALE
jgi:glutamate formiminotransferase